MTDGRAEEAIGCSRCDKVWGHTPSLERRCKSDEVELTRVGAAEVDVEDVADADGEICSLSSCIKTLMQQLATVRESRTVLYSSSS